MVTLPSRERLVPALGVAVIAFAAARVAMLPGVGFWDTAELQTVAPILGTAHPTGFPTYVIAGWLASILLTPFGEPALRMNLFAALCVAVAAGVTVDLVRALTRSVALGVAAGIGLALTEIVWAVATHAEAHALHLALVAVLFRLLVAWEGAHDEGRSSDRLLVAAAIVFGLALGNHSLTLLLAPPVGLYVLAVDRAVLRRPRLLAACLGALALTVVLVFLELPLRAGPFRAPLVYGSPNTWDGFWYIVLAEQFRGSLDDPFGNLTGKLADLASRAAMAFGPLALLVPLGFLATAMLRPRYALLSGSALALTCFFAASYVNAEIERYYLVPALIAWTWLAMLAALARDAMAPAVAGSRLGAAVTVTMAAVLLVPTLFTLDARFARVDRSRDDVAARWVDHALTAMAPDAVIVSWWSYSTPLWYAQHVEGRRPDVAIVDDRTRLDDGLGDVTDVIDANLPERPVYVIRLEPAEIRTLEERYALEYLDGTDASGLTRVVGPREAGA